MLAVLLASARSALADEEVTVRGATRRPVDERAVSGEELRTMPGAFGDPGRAIEAMPGVSRLASAIPFYFVRGATPSGTGYFIDGVRVPFVSHAPPAGGVVPSSLVSRSTFHPGSAPARFGRAVGSTLSVELKPPSYDEVHAEAAVKAYESSGILEVPFAGGKGAVAGGGRYGYTQLLLAVFSPEQRQNYWDYTSRVGYRLSSTEEASVLVMGSHDYSATNDGATERTRYDTTFHRADIRYDVARGDTKVRFAGTVGADVSGNDVGRVTDRILGARVEATHRFSSRAELEAGAMFQWDHYDVGVNRPLGIDPGYLFAPRDDILVGVYSEATWRPFRRFQVVAGLRGDLYTSERAAPAVFPGAVAEPAAARFGVGPRLSTRLEVTSRASWLASFGVQHQPPSFLLPGLAMSRLQDGLQTSVQTSQGLEVRLPAHIVVSSTLFRHDYIDLSDPAATCPSVEARLFDPIDPCYARRVRGRSYGLELLVRRSLLARVTGWISYTLSRTTRQAHAPGETVQGESLAAVSEVPSEWDRTHILSAILGLDLGRGFRAGARFSYNSGRPYSNTVLGVAVAPHNAIRLPAFHRVDVRFEKRWQLGKTAHVSAVLEAFNVTLQREVLSCTSRFPIRSGPIRPEVLRRPDGSLRSVDVCSPDSLGTLAFPSIGLEGAF